MLNPFVVRRWIAITVACFVPTITFYTMLISLGFWWALVGFLAALTLSMLLTTPLLRNPFTKMLEGGGLMAFDLNSTGIITPFLVRVLPPFITGKIYGKKIRDTWDREITFQLSEPKGARAMWAGEKLEITLTEEQFKKLVVQTDNTYKLVLDREAFKDKLDLNIKNGKIQIKKGAKAEWKNGKLLIELDEETYNSGKFALYHRPLLIWNSVLNSFVTKEGLSNDEKKTFAEHLVLYLNRLMEELSSLTRDFARYVVESLKPKESAWGKWWVWIIVIVLIGILVAMFLPAIIQQVQGFMATGKEAIAPAASNLPKGEIVTPR